MDKARQWSILTVIAVVAVLAAGWFLLVSPQRSQAADLRSQADTQRQSNAALQTKVNMLRAQAKDLPKQQARLAQIAAQMPDNPALPPLIRALSDAADRAGVELVSLAPQQPQLMTATAGTTPVAPAAPAAGKTAGSTVAPAAMASIPLAIQVQGNFYNVEQFLAAVEGLKRAMLVTGLTVGPATGAGAAASAPTAGGASAPKQVAPGTLAANITAQVFMTPKAAVAAPVQPAAPAAPAK